MNALQAGDLAGTLRIAPGRARPHNLLSSRRDWAALLTPGLPAGGLAVRLASLYSLCGESHRLCAQMAVAAAQGASPLDRPHAARLLRRETLREHVRRMALDWPLQLADTQGTGPASLQMPARLQHCPLFAPQASGLSGTKGPVTEPCLQPWLLEHVLGVAAPTWLARWEHNPATWLRQWSEQTPLWLPQLLTRVRPLLDHASAPSPFLRVHGSEAELHTLAHTLQTDPGFSRQPQWRGRCAETGTWTRLNQVQPERINTPWLRLGARLAELVRLALPDEPARCGAQWLAMGSLASGPQAGLAWVEMARGLLVHHVQLDAAGAKVLACQVVAPTEWNFHPQGAVAQALERLPTDVTPRVFREINTLFSAYDPCVRHELMTPPLANPTEEPVHA